MKEAGSGNKRRSGKLPRILFQRRREDDELQLLEEGAVLEPAGEPDVLSDEEV